MEDHGDTSAIRGFNSRGIESILVRTPPDRPGVRGTSLDVVAGDDPGTIDAYVVTTDDRPTTIVDEWDEHVGLDSAPLGVVGVGTSMRSTAVSSAASDRAARNAVRGVENLDEALAVLSEWARGSRPTVVFVDSLTGLLEETDRGSVVGFIDGVVALVKNSGGTGYFRIEPERADHTTLALCTVLVDAVIDVAGYRPVRHDVNWPDSSSDADQTATVPIQDVFDLLADRNRRLALHWLRRIDGSVEVRNLAERIVEFERRRGTSLLDEAVERTYVGLAHVHLPKLADANLIELGKDGHTVTATPTISELEPYLTVTERVDLGG